jgi:hypothetical protein
VALDTTAERRFAAGLQRDHRNLNSREIRRYTRLRD